MLNRRKLTPRGYWAVNVPNNPNSWPDGYMLEHRFVAELTIGRFLKTGEDVHHKNENKLDNSPENLQVINHAHHTILTHTGLKRSVKTRLKIAEKARMREGKEQKTLNPALLIYLYKRFGVTKTCGFAGVTKCTVYKKFKKWGYKYAQ